MNKKLLSAAVGLVALGTAGVTQAGVFFDANGAASGQTANVGTFDWDPSSILAVNGNVAVANWAANEAAGNPHGGADETLTILAQTRLTATETDANVVNTPSGLNTNYEITAVIGFNEKVTSVSGTTATFNFDAAGSTNFFEMYYDTNVNSNYLAGLGFNDGQMILSSQVTGMTTGFFANLGPGGLLDQHGSDDWGGALTISGIGTNQALNIDVSGSLATDPTFFKNTLTSMLLDNVSLKTPFTTVDPSKCFNNTANAGGIGTAGGNLVCTDAADTVPDIGTYNGLPVIPPGGPDFLVQSDFNAPVTAVPEPATVALFGIGLAGLGAAGIRRRRRAQV